MKNKVTLLLTFCLLAGLVHAADYYVSQTGNDANTGLSDEQAWASLSRVNRQVFKPGDRILFAAGHSFQGQLEAKGSSSCEAPMRVDRYSEWTIDYMRLMR